MTPAFSRDPPGERGEYQVPSTKYVLSTEY